MSEQKKSFMDEQDFDALLSRSLPELPPEDIVARTVPGKKALNRILIGYFLSTFTINGLGAEPDSAGHRPDPHAARLPRAAA